MLSTVDGKTDVSKADAWPRESLLVLVHIIVKAENESALTSLIESWSMLRAMQSGLRMVIDNSLVGSSKSNGIVERAGNAQDDSQRD